MGPSEFHIVSRDDRAADLAAFSVDLENYVSDAYSSLSGIETQRMLRALRHGVALTGVQSTLRAVEWTTSISPGNTVPFQSRVWNVVEMQNGEATLDPAPYRIIGPRTTVSYINGGSLETADITFTDVPYSSDSPPFPPGPKPSMKEVLIDKTRWVDATYDPTTGKITGQNDDADYDGRVWVVEQRFENPAILSNVAQAHNLRLSGTDGGYPPPHLFYLTRLIETFRQEGNRPDRAFWTAQATFGAPFAYAAGTIKEYVQEGGMTWARIEKSDGTQTGSFLPSDATGGESALKSTGTEVEQFETLVTGGTSASQPSGADRSYGAPIEASGTDRSSKTITLSTSSHGLSAGDRARFRIVNQGVNRFLVVTAVNGADLTVRGEVPPITSSDWAYLMPRTVSADGPGTLSLTVSTPYTDGNGVAVEKALSRMMPPDISFSVNGAPDGLDNPGYITVR